MYCLIIVIRPKDLPTDAAALTEMVLALDAENEKLRVAMRTLNDMVFGKRSERLAVMVAEQLALELDDVATHATPPPAANDDQSATKTSGATGTVRISKFAWYLPLYRQVQMLASQGVRL